MTCRIRRQWRQHHKIPQYPFVKRENELVVVIVNEVLEEADGDTTDVRVQ